MATVIVPLLYLLHHIYYEGQKHQSCNKDFEDFEDFGGALCKDFIIIRVWEPVSIIHYTRPRPGACINHPLH